MYYVPHTLTIRDYFEDEQSSLLKEGSMLQKFSILPYAFILFLFGITFLPVSVVAADFAACQQMNPGGNFRIMKQQKNCFRDLAKALGAKQSARAEFRACRKIKPKGKAAPMQQKIDCFMDVASSLMPNMAPPMEDPNMPPMEDPNMSPMPGTGTDLGAHCGEIQAKNEKKRMRKEVRCLRRALHEHKPTVKLRQTKDGLGAYGCGVRKTGSKPAQIACLRDLLDGPAGAPDMAAPMEDPNMPPMEDPLGDPLAGHSPETLDGIGLRLGNPNPCEIFLADERKIQHTGSNRTYEEQCFWLIGRINDLTEREGRSLLPYDQNRQGPRCKGNDGGHEAPAYCERGSRPDLCTSKSGDSLEGIMPGGC